MRVLLILGVAAVCGGGCAARYGTLALGQYELFAPFADLTRGRREVELTRPGYVAILDIRPFDPAYRPPQDYVTFRAIFPLTVHDSTYFPAGTHALRYNSVTETMRVLCADVEVPSIDGCREYRGGPSSIISGPVPTSTHYLIIVAEEYVDPFTVAFHLNETVRASDTFAVALHRRDVQAVAEEISAGIADVPGLRGWSGYYAVRTN
jgi:hypothetical protein